MNAIIKTDNDGVVIDEYIRNVLEVRSQGYKAVRAYLARELTDIAFYEYDRSSGKSLTANGARQICALLSLETDYECRRYELEGGGVGYELTARVRWPDGRQVGMAIADVNTRDFQKGRRKPDAHTCLGLAQAYALRRAISGLATSIKLVELMDYPEEPEGYPYAKKEPPPPLSIVDRDHIKPASPDWFTDEVQEVTSMTLGTHSLTMEGLGKWMRGSGIAMSDIKGPVEFTKMVDDYIQAEYDFARGGDDD